MSDYRYAIEGMAEVRHRFDDPTLVDSRREKLQKAHSRLWAALTGEKPTRRA